MKKFGISIILASLVIFTGCSQKNVEPTSTNTKETEQQVAKIIEEKEVVAEKTSNTRDDGFYYTINGKEEFIENIYFDYDKYNLTPYMKTIVVSNAGKLANLEEGKLIKLEGNCDERGTEEYNFQLGLKRAETVKKALIANGVSADKLYIISYGKGNPVCTNANENCWGKNRRTEYKIDK